MKYGQVVKTALWVQDPKDQLDNAVLGIAGEAGEIADHFKKIKFHPHSKRTNAELRQEIGDVLFYVALLNEVTFGDSLLDVAKDNIKKLRGRWPERYNHINLDELSL